MRVLLVEDDTALASLMIAQGAGRDIKFVHMANPQKALEHLTTDAPYDVLVLDRMMPHMDGLTLLRHIRQIPCTTPALILSALGEVEDRVDGLEAGGDDYLVKPFAFTELEARLGALARRVKNEGNAPPDVLQLADLTLDPLKRVAMRGHQRIDLTPREYSLLFFLMQQQGQAVTRQMLMTHVWAHQFHTQTNVIDMHISKLRAKIDKGFTPLIHTVRGIGFMMRDGDA